MILTGAEVDVLMALKQRGALWDGDIPSKAGRTSLIDKGLVRRDRKFPSGPYAGTQMNELTEDGAKLAAAMLDVQSHKAS